MVWFVCVCVCVEQLNFGTNFYLCNNTREGVEHPRFSTSALLANYMLQRRDEPSYQGGKPNKIHTALHPAYGQ